MKRLRDLREDADKTQQEVAQAVNLSTAAYGQYERGTREMTYETMIALADYFDVSLDYLFDRTEMPKPPLDLTPADHQLLQRYKALDGRGRRTVRAAIDFETRLLETTQKEKD